MDSSLWRRDVTISVKHLFFYRIAPNEVSQCSTHFFEYDATSPKIETHLMASWVGELLAAGAADFYRGHCFWAMPFPFGVRTLPFRSHRVLNFLLQYIRFWETNEFSRNCFPVAFTLCIDINDSCDVVFHIPMWSNVSINIQKTHIRQNHLKNAVFEQVFIFPSVSKSTHKNLLEYRFLDG